MIISLVLYPSCTKSTQDSESRAAGAMVALSSEDVTGIVTLGAESGGGPFLVDVGTLTPGEERECNIVVKNSQKSEIESITAQSSCSCTILEHSSMPIPPGKSGTLRLRYRASNRRGMESRTIHMTATSNRVVHFDLSLNAMVRNTLYAEPSRFDIGVLSKHSFVRRNFNVLNFSDQLFGSVAIRGTLPAGVEIDSHLIKSPGDASARQVWRNELRITPNEFAMGHHRIPIQLQLVGTNGVVVEPVECSLLVEVDVRPPVAVIPPRIAFSSMIHAASRKKEITIKLLTSTVASDFEPNVIVPEPFAGEFAVSIKRTGDQTWSMIVERVSNDASEGVREFEILLDGFPEEVGTVRLPVLVVTR
ncbi:MAG: DUF1573 domain-containing protein [Pirellula sp.]